ncbi:Zn-ribbon domain-containing OB-fold protein [Sphingobium subterraneum]|uniref:ChsH2 C-terminal OB-fold domain-containing protein n=1 Tax=Sphingobium subterraneum TaxID=627688 RepID=A0A841IZZ7_9SPHN|nr:OB-fold domain-containing protein [Sphingobium subterraneum]MBB6123994.1 hypothetical protein [Sphingobium subterraneum]
MRAIAEGLFTHEWPPRLIGGRERLTGRMVFPCPAGDGYEPVALTSEGTVWSWTVQRFRPKSPPYGGPDSFAPWIVAYVELAGQVIVEARLVHVDPDAVRIDMPVRLAPVPLDPAADDPVMIPAFEPLGDEV